MKQEITIGNYSIKPTSDYPDGSKAVWIEHLPDGEGGQFPMEALEKVIAEFYNKNF